MSIVSYSGSYIGRRPNNEDTIGRTVPRDPLILQEKGRLYLVCDGMGGTRGGEVASQMAVEAIMERYYAGDGENDWCLESAIREASALIADRADRESNLADMGSTVAALVVLPDHYLYSHVGDSRLYLMRDGRLTRLTRDHLHILDELGVSESEAETHPHKNILSRALGYPEASEPETGLMAARSGDRLMLCSDGLSDAVTMKQIASALECDTPKLAVEALLDAAEERDAQDNATALVVFIGMDDCIETPTQRIPLAVFNVLNSPDTGSDRRMILPETSETGRLTRTDLERK